MWVKSSHYGASNTCVELSSEVSWRTACGANTGCVEVGDTGTRIKIRDSKFPDMPHLDLSTSEFGSLLNALKTI